MIVSRIEKFLRSISPRIVVQRNSIDDFCLDCTLEIEERLKFGSKSSRLRGRFCLLSSLNDALDITVREEIQVEELSRV